MLLVVIAAILVATYYLLSTNDITPEERDEMLQDKEMWP